MIATLIEVLAPLALAAVGLGYARRCVTLSRRGQPVPAWRQACFGVGLLIVLLADPPPLAEVAEELVVAHMAQHLLIGDIAALLIVLGLTGPLLQPILRRPALRWLRVLGYPAVALPLWLVNLYLWHLGALYQGVLESPALHVAQHVGFCFFGIVMWMPLGATAKARLVWQRRQADLSVGGALRRRRPRQRPRLGGPPFTPTTPRARPSGKSRRSPTKAALGS